MTGLSMPPRRLAVASVSGPEDRRAGEVSQVSRGRQEVLLTKPAGYRESAQVWTATTWTENRIGLDSGPRKHSREGGNSNTTFAQIEELSQQVSTKSPLSQQTIQSKLTIQITEMKLTIEGLEKERDFYFGKLRDIEVSRESLPSSYVLSSDCRARDGW